MEGREDMLRRRHTSQNNNNSSAKRYYFIMKSTNKTARSATILVYVAAIAVTAAAAASEVDGHSEEKTGADPDAHAYGTDPHDAGEGGGGGHESHPVTAILFPWFAEIIGVLVFFVLSVSAAFQHHLGPCEKRIDVFKDSSSFIITDVLTFLLFDILFSSKALLPRITLHRDNVSGWNVHGNRRHSPYGLNNKRSRYIRHAMGQY